MALDGYQILFFSFLRCLFFLFTEWSVSYGLISRPSFSFFFFLVSCFIRSSRMEDLTRKNIMETIERQGSRSGGEL